MNRKPTNAQQIEKALKQSEVFYRHLAQLTPEALVVHSERKIVYINPAALSFVGAKDPSEIIGQPIMNFVHADSKELIEKRVEMMLKNKKVTPVVEEKFVSLTGNIIYAEVKSVPFIFNNKPAILSILHDITRRKLAEQELWNANQTFEAVIKASPLAVYVLDPKGRVEMWNTVSEKLFGWKQEEVLGKELPIIHNEKKKEFKQAMRVLLSGKSFGKETVRQRKNGSLVDISLSASPIFDRNGKVYRVVSILSDITERKRIENELYISKNQLETTLANIADGVLVQDAIGNILYANQVAIEMFGYRTLKDMVKQQFSYLTKFEYKDEQEKPYPVSNMPGRRAIGGDKNSSATLKVINKKTKEEKWITVRSTAIESMDQRTVMVINTIHDITERRNSEQALRESEERLRLALNAGNIGVYDWDIVNDKITWTDATRAIHRQENQGMTFDEYTNTTHPEDRKLVIEAVERALKHKEPYNLEFRIIDAEGEVRWITTRAEVTFNKKGKPIRMLGATMDITKRKELEHQKDDFMGIVSHELKTPVTSLKAYEQVLQLRFIKQGDEKAAEMLGRMDSQINKLTKLISDLLDVTKIEGGKFIFNETTFDFDTLVEEVVEEVQRTTDKHNIVIKGKTGKKVYGDRDRIGQVIINLLTNAIKYSPRSKNIIVKSEVEKNEIRLEIKDYGVGIPQSELPFIFDRFFRVDAPTHTTVPGIGLGLYISKEIIKRQGGNIWAKSTPGKGSVFSFSLPLSSSKNPK